MTEFDPWLLGAGLGLFLLGMYMIEKATAALGGDRFKKLLHKSTNNSWKAVGVGIVITAILQSSSLVSLITIALVGASMMQLRNAIGVLIGANIGTTFTSLLVAGVGFGDFSISAFAFPLLTLGGISLIFTQKGSYKHMSLLLAAFGILFLGLDMMKTSVEGFQAAFDLAAVAQRGLPAFFGVGILATVVLQSSSAVGVLALAALNSGIIGFPGSIAIVMGANIGTTFTAVIGSWGGQNSKRQLAFAHVMFNVVSALFGILFFWPYIRITERIVGDNIVLGNAVLNLIFNTTTALVFLPLLPRFAVWIQRIIQPRNHALDMSKP